MPSKVDQPTLWFKPAHDTFAAEVEGIMQWDIIPVPEQPQIFDVSNLDDKGEIVTDADPARREANKSNFF